MSIYIRLLKTAGLRDEWCREDFLTECFAESLRRDDDFLRRTWRMLTGETSQTGIDVQTQVVSAGSRFDMVLVSGTIRIAVEIKLYARQGDDQLGKYLRTDDLDGVAFLTAYPAAVDQAVRAHPKYLRPLPFDHFLWQDVFVALPDTSRDRALTAELRDLLEHLQLAPPSLAVGQIGSDDPELRKRAVIDFMKLYRPIASELSAAGWRHEIAVTPQLDRIAPEGSPVALLSLRPDPSRGEFQVSVYTADADLVHRAAESLRASGLPVRTKRSVAKAESRRYVLTVSQPLGMVVHPNDPAASMRRIADLTRNVVAQSMARAALQVTGAAV